jgi:hypothetical protein
MKVKKDIITGILVNHIGETVILVIKYVKTFKTDITVFIGIKRHIVTSH